MPKQRNKPSHSDKERRVKEEVQSLVTTQEITLKSTSFSSMKLQSNKIRTAQFPSDSDDDEEMRKQMSLEDLKKGNADRLSTHISHLLAKNKINAKNAFEVPLIQLNQTQNYKQMEGDNNWRKISSTLDSNNKIYGYRVDAAHNFTYKVLELVTRQNEQTTEQGQQKRRERYEQLTLNSQFFAENDDDTYVHTLERNYKNINIAQLQTFFNVNPILEKTKRKFDQQGLRGMLLENIGINADLRLRINLDHKSDEISIHPLGELIEEQVEKQQPQSLNILDTISRICEINDLVSKYDGVIVKREDGMGELEMMWHELDNLVDSKCNKAQNEENGKQDTIEVSIPLADIEKQSTPISSRNMQEEQLQGQDKDIEPKESPEAEHPQADIIPQDRQNQQIDPNGQVQKLIQELIQTIEVPQIDQTNEHIKSSLILDYAANKSIQIPITNEIQFKSIKFTNNNDFILHQLAIDDDHDNGILPAIEQWMNNENKPKRQRKQRLPRDPTLYHVNFDYSAKKQYSKRKAIKSQIISLDKFQKKLIKKLIKSLQKQVYPDKNIFADTSKWKPSFSQPSLLRETKLKQPEPSKEQPEIDGTLFEQTNPQGQIVIDLLDPEHEQSTTINKQAIIKHIKQKIKHYIFTDNLTSFHDIYAKLTQEHGSVSPALCFLTILHISNENNLDLTESAMLDFAVHASDPINSEP